MKTVYRIIIQVVLGIVAFTSALSAHISFTNGSWNEIREKAANENRFIFVDAFVPWCGPCKLMAKNVFTNDTVATFYNERFLNWEVDVNDSLNKEFAELYHITAYPALLWFTPDGRFIFSEIGYHTGEQLIFSGENALREPEFSIETASMRNAFETGTADKSLLLKYYFTLRDSGRSCDSVGAATVRLLNPEDLKNDSAFRVWFDMDQRMNSVLMDYFFSQHSYFQEKYPKESDQKPRYVIAYNIEEARKTHDALRFAQVQSYIQHAYDSQEMIQMMAMARKKFK